jgi:thiol-disulfide isomerase/thioredoxin
MRTALVLIFASIAILPAIAEEPIAQKSPAPEFSRGAWINTHSPLTLEARRGKVTIVHFWTFGCINCKHNLGAYNNWARRFRDQDVAVIGIHTPEFDSEKVQAAVEKAVKQFGIDYPVLIDNDYANWQRWNQQFWPVVYLVDKKGNVRYRWEGELNYRNSGGEQKMAQLVERLLQEND